MASFRRRMSWAAVPREIGSSPAKGSSYMTSSGSRTMARASATRRAMPPEIWLGIRSRAPRNPTACNFISTMSRTSSSGRSVCSRSGKATFSNTLMSVNRAPNWNSMPMRRRTAKSCSRAMAPTSCPSNSTWPCCARCWPPIRRSTVVLPPPEAPISAVTLPRGTCSETSRRITRSPYENVTLRSSTKRAGSAMLQKKGRCGSGGDCQGKPANCDGNRTYIHVCL